MAYPARMDGGLRTLRRLLRMQSQQIPLYVGDTIMFYLRVNAGSLAAIYGG